MGRKNRPNLCTPCEGPFSFTYSNKCLLSIYHMLSTENSVTHTPDKLTPGGEERLGYKCKSSSSDKCFKEKLVKVMVKDGGGWPYFRRGV